MPFKVRRDSINHSPDWYESRIRDEHRIAPSVRAMFENDVGHIDACKEPQLTWPERLELYRQRWDAIMSGRQAREDLLKGRSRADDYLGELVEVMEREGQAGFRPEHQYLLEPFDSIGKLMDEHEVPECAVREFLKWRSKQKASRKGQQTRKKRPTKTDRMRARFREMIGH